MNHSPSQILIRQMRGILRFSRYSMVAEAQPLLEQAFGLLRMEDRRKPEIMAASSELAYAVAAMLDATMDQAFMRLGLGILLKSGVCGMNLIVAFLGKRKAAHDVLAGILNAFPVGDRLHLVNCIFRKPRAVEPRLLQWAYDTLRANQGENPDAVLMFLDELATDGIPLAYPLQRQLLGSRFGVWIQQLLSLELDPEQTLFMLRTTGALHSHQLARSLARRLKNAHPNVLAGLVKAIGQSGRKKDQELSRMLAGVLKTGSAQVQAVVIQALGRLQSDSLPIALAYALQKAPTQRSRLLVTLFQAQHGVFTEVMRRLPATEHRDLVLFLVVLLNGCNRSWLERTLERLGAAARAGKDWAALVSALRNYLDANVVAPAPPPLAAPQPVPSAPARTAPEPKGLAGVAGRLLGRVRRTVRPEDSETSREYVKMTVFRQAMESGGPFAKQTYEGIEAPQGTFSGLAFADCVFSMLDLSNSTFTKVLFERCSFKHLDFDASSFKEVRFVDCQFLNCRFSGSQLEKVQAARCNFAGVSLSSALTRRVVLHECLLSELDCSGARLEGWKVDGCRFEAANFSLAELKGGEFEGVEFFDCLFDACCLERSRIYNTRVMSAMGRNCRCVELESDEPFFMSEILQTAERYIEVAARSLRLPEPPPQLGSAEGIQLMRRLVDAWLAERDALRRRQAFLANNSRRLEWATCMLGSPGDEFLTILPGLVESGVAFRDAPVGLVPACSIFGYVPGYSARQLLRKHRIDPEQSQERKIGDSASPSKAIPIEALFTIGSTGTIAQAKASDIDLWLCFDAERVSEAARQRLRGKCDLIERWAEEAFDLEVHFFLMDTQSIRDNNFGFTDKESAGSTQAQLLKEEFYRTAVYLGGKKPAWWHFPAALDDPAYSEEFARALEASDADARNILDLGNLDEIPREEFFGASLWQIVKAMKSPFKSAMKLALLDKYIHARDASVLVCNRVKANLFQDVHDLWEIDPYAVMFREVFEYYGRSGQEEAQRLMRLAFLQKTGLYLSAKATGRFYELQSYSFMEYFFPYSESDIASHVEPGRSESSDSASAPEGFGELVEVGDMTVRFMFATYTAIHGLWSQYGEAMRITQDDLTKIGRKVFSYLQPKKNKIMRIPFMDPSKHRFAVLELTSESQPGMPPVWIMRGETYRRNNARPVKEELRRDQCLERLLLWLVANGFYPPNPTLEATYLEPPLSIADVNELCATLHNFFSPALVFDPDINENLNPERAVRAMVIANLTVQREDKTLRRAVMIWSTNWGELFCQPTPRNLPALRDGAYGFVKDNAGNVGSDIELQSFIPSRSLCPKIFLG